MDEPKRIALIEMRAEIEILIYAVLILRDDEQEYYDNMPENLQDSEQLLTEARAVESTVLWLDDTINYLERACTSIKEAINATQIV